MNRLHEDQVEDIANRSSDKTITWFSKAFIGVIIGLLILLFIHSI